MGKALVLGTILGGITLFLWGGIYHDALPIEQKAFLAFQNEDLVRDAIVKSAPRSGTYFLPYINAGDKAGAEAAQKKLMEGPFAFASIRVGPMGSIGSLFGVQLLTNLLTAFLLTLLLLHGGPAPSLRCAAFTTGVGLSAWLARSVPAWNWYSFSTAYTLAELGDLTIGFALAGLVISAVLPKTRN